MPERYVSVRWPDGQAQRIYSPSTVNLFQPGCGPAVPAPLSGAGRCRPGRVEKGSVVEDYFAAGERVPVDEFVARSRAALGAASERVRAAYGYPCGRAAAALAEVTATAGSYAGGDVTVERIEP